MRLDKWFYKGMRKKNCRCSTMAVQIHRKHKVVGSNPTIGLRESETDTQITLGSYPSNSGFDSRFRTLRIGRSYFVLLFLNSAGMSLRHIPKQFRF